MISLLGRLLFVFLIGWIIGAWILMLLIGALHHAWWAAIPTISYGGALQIELVVMLGVVIGGLAKGIIEAVSS
ncbi:hypothetical protein AB0395_47095 [Streptosporangium sp. NPDC051023]|uniref:hypothetical protein n=1 Tax=Streptosporangium sp. NPDC051023 TaxID=3155410 RepID=UPI00344F7FE2